MRTWKIAALGAALTAALIAAIAHQGSNGFARGGASRNTLNEPRRLLIQSLHGSPIPTRRPTLNLGDHSAPPIGRRSFGSDA
jgi:hypothetical protein